MSEDNKAGGAVSGAQHTPGPWSVESPFDFEATIVEANKPTHEWRFIASCKLPEGDDDQDFHSREVWANARLIAAAPDLLAALEEMLDAASEQSYCGSRCQLEATSEGEAEYQAVRAKARAAIAKATGA